MTSFEQLLETVTYNMRRLRDRKNIRQYQMAEKLGHQSAVYNKMELGKSDLRLSILYAFATEVDVPIVDLFLDKEVEKQPFMQKLRQLMELPENERSAIERMIDMTIERHHMLEAQQRKDVDAEKKERDSGLER